MNTFIICLSLKYINKNYELINNISKWVHFELERYNYSESKFIKSLDKKDFEIIKTLIKLNKNLNLLSNYLVIFCSHRANSIRILVNNGVDVDEQDNSKNYHLHLDIVKLLVDNGANIHTQNDEALMRATHDGHYDIVKFLIDNGANVNAHYNYTLRIAKFYRYTDIIKLFTKNGLN